MNSAIRTWFDIMKHCGKNSKASDKLNGQFLPGIEVIIINGIINDHYQQFTARK